MRVHVYLRSGSVIDLDLEKFTTKGSGHGVNKLDWTSAKGAVLRLHHINLPEIVAITYENDDR